MLAGCSSRSLPPDACGPSRTRRGAQPRTTGPPAHTTRMSAARRDTYNQADRSAAGPPRTSQVVPPPGPSCPPRRPAARPGHAPRSPSVVPRDRPRRTPRAPSSSGASSRAACG